MGETSIEVYSLLPVVNDIINEVDKLTLCASQEIIGGNILPMCRGDNFKFHAAGREDIDVIKIHIIKFCLKSVKNNF